jgi:hypothetical protein
MKSHNLPMTYVPKIEAVFNGLCTQTIRMGRKYAVGDKLLIHDKKCKACGHPPKWAPTQMMQRCEILGCANFMKGMNRFNTLWNRRLRAEIVVVYNVKFTDLGIIRPREYIGRNGEYSWLNRGGDGLAAIDFIDPPTGLQLKKVLEHLNGSPFTDEPEDAQIIRWKVLEAP